MVKLHKIKKRYRPIQAEPVIELDMVELHELLDRLKSNMSESDYHKLCAALDTLGLLSCELDKKRVSIQRLKQMLFGQSTEKTETVFKDKQETPKEPLPPPAQKCEKLYTKGPPQPHFHS